MTKMAYSRGKRGFRSRRAPSYGRRSVGRRGKGGASALERYVESKVKRQLQQSQRGRPRSVATRMVPSSATWESESKPPVYQPLPTKEWQAFSLGDQSAYKYALLPISEIIPRQRLKDCQPDDRQRSHDTVRIKGVSVRMTVCHSEGVRLMMFAFRNMMRRGTIPNTATRPFQIIEDESGVPREVWYTALTKESLRGFEDHSKCVPHLGLHEGPFAVVNGPEGSSSWNTVDDTLFTSRLSKEVSKPVGRVQVQMDNGPSKKLKGRVVNLSLSTGLNRTMQIPSAPFVSSFTGHRYREINVYIELDERERFTLPTGSHSANENPLEFFLGFDTPKPFTEEGGMDGCSGRITALSMEVYYA
jgi:hypothetical protein